MNRTYYDRLACLADPSKASARHQRESEIRVEINRVQDENYQADEVRKAWHQLKSEGFELPNCTKKRLSFGIVLRKVTGQIVDRLLALWRFQHDLGFEP